MSIPWPIFALAALFAAMFLLSLLLGKRGKLPYTRRDALFTPAERHFLRALDAAAAREYRVMGKVRMADLLRTQTGLNNKARASATNKILAKHIDFVLLDPESLEPRCVIELDDRSHRARAAKETDQFKNEAFASAALPLVRFPVRRDYEPAMIREAVVRAIAGETAPEAAQSSAPKPCPRCGAPMVLRTAARGKNAGRSFWGCTDYPACKAVEDIPD